MWKFLETNPKEMKICELPDKRFKITILKMFSEPSAGDSPVILATQKAEIRRIVVQSQPQANSS
jgi:hypothetical protein